MKPKEYLVSIGELTEVKRGRLSLAHIEMCKKAAAEGISIEGYEVSRPTAAQPNVEVKKVAVTNEKVVSEVFIRYELDEFVAVEADGTRHDLKQACKCGYSLVGHICENPQILVKGKSGHQPVTIVRR